MPPPAPAFPPTNADGSMPALPGKGTVMQRLLDRLNGLSRLCLIFGGFLILGAAFLVTADVIARKVLGWTLAGADELSGYAFGISTMLALSAALLGRSNIRIDIAYQAFSKPARAFADLLGLVLFVGFIGVVTYLAYGVVADSFQHWSRSITPLRTPLAIPQSLWFFGLALALVTGVVLILAVVSNIVRRDWSAVQTMAGIKSVDEQIDEELHAAEDAKTARARHDDPARGD